MRAGTRVRLEPARGGAPIGAVVAACPLTDPASGTFKVVATFRRRSANPEAGAEARFILPTQAGSEACVIPSTTIIEAEGDSTWVWRCDADRVHRCVVRLGPTRGDAIQIESGLGRECNVVVGTDRPLRDGSVVEVVDSR
jgi:hypothetical protein